MKLGGTMQKAKTTNSQKIRELEKSFENLQVAIRVSQLLIRQLLENYQNVTNDLGKAYQSLNELQYKALAMEAVGGFDREAVTTKVEELRLKDFNEASDEEDAKSGFTVGDVVESDSTVIITSTTESGADSIFRSRIKLADCGVPALIDGLVGKPVGTTVQCTINNIEHTVELLGIRNPPPAPVEEEKVEPEAQAAEIIKLPVDTTVH